MEPAAKRDDVVANRLGIGEQSGGVDGHRRKYRRWVVSRRAKIGLSSLPARRGAEAWTSARATGTGRVGGAGRVGGGWRWARPRGGWLRVR
jgi:hypothetical protein